MIRGNEDLSLPILLAGPILRRAEPEKVCIWIACSKPVTIRAEIFKFIDLKSTDVPYNKVKQTSIIGIGSAEAIRLGEHLYVGLVIARPIQEAFHTTRTLFPTDELLAYDIELSYKEDPIKKNDRLNDFGLLNGKNAIIYKGDNDISLPTFFLRGQNTPLNILYGSCRKLHGKGEDCLVIADELVATSLKDLKKRPSVLFLIGDQIYADDVAGPLIRYLTEFSIRLLGWEEQIHGIGQKLSAIPVGKRQLLIEKHARFTSTDAGNHLLSFGEFAAMYLIAWNNENWPYSFPGVTKAIPHKEQKRYYMEIEQLERARKALPAVRRILANIPTYMIFDDHEITDDWNITKEWHENVKSSDCGKQIVANGFAAFWAFQGWGNDADSYNDEFIVKVTEYLMKNGNPDVKERKAFEDYLWNFHGWTFIAPTNPSTIFLDTRTQRHYDSFDGPPILLNEEGLCSVSKSALQANYRNCEPLIIVSPTPVFGFELAEQLQEYLASKSNVYKWDVEAWASNEKGFICFLTFLINSIAPHYCIFLSGDVHYGFTQRATFKVLQEKNEKKELATSVIQLTSSALKTSSLSKDVVINEILGRLSQLFSSRQSLRIGWNDDILARSKKLKYQNNSVIYAIINRIKRNYYGLIKQQPKSTPPDWVESRYIVQSSGFRIPSLVITDNNIGLVTISKDTCKIFHKLLVRKGNKIKVHEAVLQIDAL